MSSFISTGNWNPGSATGLNVGVSISPSPMIIAAGFYKAGSSMRGVRAPLSDTVEKVMTGERGAIARTFRQQGNPANSWHPLSERSRTARSKAGFGPSRPILMRTKALYRAAIAKARWDYRSTPREGVAYVKSFPAHVPQAASMHFGHAPHGIPARPFMVIGAQDEARMGRQFGRWVDNRLKRDMALR